jgi:hypothetical protein
MLLGVFASLVILFGINLKAYYPAKTQKVSLVQSQSNSSDGDSRSTPVDNEEDDGEDSDDKINSAPLDLRHVVTCPLRYCVHEDPLFCDPPTELVSPPPKSWLV